MFHRPTLGMIPRGGSAVSPDIETAYTSGNYNTIVMPDHQAGDLLVAIQHHGNALADGGWALNGYYNTTQMNYRIYSKIAASSAEATGTFDALVTGVIIARFRNVHGSWPLGAIRQHITATQSLDHLYSSFQPFFPQQARNRIFAVALRDGGTANGPVVVTPPAGFTQVITHAGTLGRMCAFIRDGNVQNVPAETITGTDTAEVDYGTCYIEIVAPEVQKAADTGAAYQSFRSTAVAAGVPAGWARAQDTSIGSFAVANSAFGLGRALVATTDPTTASRIGAVWDALGDLSGDREVLALVRMPYAAFSTNVVYGNIIHTLGSGTYPNENYAVFSFRTRTVSNVTDHQYLRKGIAGTQTLGAVNNDETWGISSSANLWYVRIKRVGTTLSFKQWVHGTVEPASFETETLAVADASLAAGKVGFAGGAPNGSMQLHFLSVATGGASAPRYDQLT